MQIVPRCPECGRPGSFAGTDERGAFFLCESPDGACVVFDYWPDRVRTYRATYRGEYDEDDEA
jgi:hypothetical protein